MSCDWKAAADQILQAWRDRRWEGLLEDDLLDLAADMKRADLKTYAQLRDDLQAAGVKLRMWEPAVAARDAASGGTRAGANEREAKPFVETVLEMAEFVRDADGNTYAIFEVASHHEFWPLASSRFDEWLSGVAYREFKAPVSPTWLEQQKGALASVALHEGRRVEVHTRVAMLGDDIYLDLADDEWRVVKISADGWEVLTKSPVCFRRPVGMSALPVPQRGGDLKQLRRFVNVEDDEFILVLAWLVAALYPRGPYPILAFSGEQGTAKSTSTKLLRRMIDPNRAPLRALPRNVPDLMIAARNGRVIGFDNVSAIIPWLADALCSVATGAGFATRALYTSDEEAIFQAACPILLNGIGDVSARSDLLDRAIVITPLPIPHDKRQTEAAVEAGFVAEHPRLLGALLDVLVAVLITLPSVQLDELPRMADFAKLATAAERALGFAAGSFMEAYRANREDSRGAALDASPLVHPLQVLLQKEGTWEGPLHELLSSLGAIVPDATRASKAWPQNPRKLRSDLDRIGPDLRAIGIWVSKSQRRGHERERIVEIKRVPCDPPKAAGDEGTPSATSSSSEPQVAAAKSSTADGADGTPPSLHNF